MRLRSCEDPNQGLQSREERMASKHRILPSSFLGDSERMSGYEKERSGFEKKVRTGNDVEGGAVPKRESKMKNASTFCMHS